MIGEASDSNGDGDIDVAKAMSLTYFISTEETFDKPQVGTLTKHTYVKQSVFFVIITIIIIIIAPTFLHKIGEYICEAGFDIARWNWR